MESNFSSNKITRSRRRCRRKNDGRRQAAEVACATFWIVISLASSPRPQHHPPRNQTGSIKEYLMRHEYFKYGIYSGGDMIRHQSWSYGSKFSEAPKTTSTALWRILSLTLTTMYSAHEKKPIPSLTTTMLHSRRLLQGADLLASSGVCSLSLGT